MQKIKAFCKRKNIVISAKRYGVDALGAMAQGLFCTLLVGTILDTIGKQFGIVFLTDTFLTIKQGDVTFYYTIGGFCSLMVGPAMAVAIGKALEAPPLVLFSLITVGFATNVLGGTGGPLAVFFVAILAAEVGKAISKETKIDILVTPIVTILAGIGFAALVARPIGTAATSVGDAIKWATELQPFFMGILVSVIIGVAHLLRRHLRQSGTDGSGGRRCRCGLLRPDGRIRRHELPGEPLGRSGGPGHRHQYAANGQHRPQCPHLDPPYAGLRRYRPHRHVFVQAANERLAGVLRYGHLRLRGTDRRVHRLA